MVLTRAFPAVDIYAAVAASLAERKKGNQLNEFLRNIKGTIYDDDWDEVLLMNTIDLILIKSKIDFTSIYSSETVLFTTLKIVFLLKLLRISNILRNIVERCVLQGAYRGVKQLLVGNF